MSSLEINKIVAAILTAGVVAMTAGFVAELLINPDELEENVYRVAIAAGAATQEATGAAEAGPEPVSPLLASADAQAGKKGARKCGACHTFDQGGAQKIGPNLWNVVNRRIAGVEGFGYSSALQGLSGRQWTYEDLNAFLAKPKDFAPGTKMTFAGLKKIDARADLIAYLRSLSDSPTALPE